MTPCPESALPVVEILRRDVRRPETLPTLAAARGPMGKIDVLRWESTCPLGMLPGCSVGSPSSLLQFVKTPKRNDGLPLDYQSMDTFWRWWDHLTEADAESAVEFIWPTKGA